MKSSHGFDFLIPLLILPITAFGLLSIWSFAPTLFLQQLGFIVFGYLLFIIFSQIDLRVFEYGKWWLYFGSLFLLILTFILGEVSRGSVRWLALGPFNLQPSEVVKPFLIIFFSFHLYRQKMKIKNLFMTFLLLILPLILILKQPDLGSTLVLFSAFIGLFLALAIPLKLIFGTLAIIAISLPVSWLFLADYQRSRLTSFLNPNIDPLGTGYNLIQSVISAGSGEIFGRGLGRGTQSHLSFLPEHHTDFIFASFVEETGLIGGILLLVLYLLLLWRILEVTRKTKEDFTRLFGLGVFMMFLFQIFVNIGMNLGIVPVAGVTLPLFSYGGSSIFATMICLGMIESMTRFQKPKDPLEIR